MVIYYVLLTMLKCDENIICEWHIQSVWNIIIYHLSTRWSMICFMIRLSSRWIVKPGWCSFQQLLDGRETYVRHISLNKWSTSGVRKTPYSLPHCLNIVLQLGKRSNKTALFPCIELLFCIAWGHKVGGQPAYPSQLSGHVFAFWFKIYLNVLLNVHLKIIE